MFFATKRMLIIFAEEIRKISLKPEALGRGGIRAEESHEDVLEAFRINAADHATCVRNGNGSALFRDDDRDRVTDLGNAQSGAMTEAHLPLRGAVENTACRQGHDTGRGHDAPLGDD